MLFSMGAIKTEFMKAIVMEKSATACFLVAKVRGK